MSLNLRPGPLVRRIVATMVVVATTVSIGAVASSASPSTHSANRTVDYVQQLQSALTAAATQSTLPVNVTPPTSAWSQLWSDYGLPSVQTSCWDVAKTLDTIPKCVMGSHNATRTIVLAGDSQAFMWTPAFDAWGKANHVKVVVLTKAACQPWPDAHQSYYDGSTFPQCGVFQRAVVAKINSLHPAFVVVAGLAPQWPTGYCASCTSSQRLGMVSADVKAFISSIRASRAHVAVIEASPDFYTLASTHPLTDPLCLSAHPTSVQTCNSTPLSQLQNGLMKLALTSSALPKGVVVVPLDKLLCSAVSCPMVVGSRLVLSDNDHVSTQWAQYVVPAFTQIVNALHIN